MRARPLGWLGSQIPKKLHEGTKYFGCARIKVVLLGGNGGRGPNHL